MRSWILEKLRGAFRGERGERLLIALSHRFPRARPLVYGLTPQPSHYDPDEERIVVRHGIRFRLRPRHYFQWHHFFQRDDPVLDELVRLAAGKRVFIDVGANVGVYTLVVRKVMARDARVLAVEPAPSTNAALSEHVTWSGAEGVEVLAWAVSDSTGLAQLEIQADDWGKASLRRRGTRETLTQVSTKTLDDLVRECGLDGVDLLKIDVEGHELEVLRGGKRAIAAYKPTIVIEFSPQWMSLSAVASLTDAVETLVDEGYEVRRILPGGSVEFPAGRLRSIHEQMNLVLLSPRRVNSSEGG